MEHPSVDRLSIQLRRHYILFCLNYLSIFHIFFLVLFDSAINTKTGVFDEHPLKWLKKGVQDPPSCLQLSLEFSVKKYGGFLIFCHKIPSVYVCIRKSRALDMLTSNLFVLHLLSKAEERILQASVTFSSYLT